MEAGTLPGMRISFDDAFEDGGDDDQDAQFQFTSDAIRSELARQSGLAWVDGEDNVVEDVQLEREAYDPDESVSTIDINSSRPYSPTSISLPHTPEPRISSAYDSGDLEEVPRRGVDRNGTPSHSRYPSVVIDVSKAEVIATASTSDPTLHGSIASSDTAVSTSSDPSSSKHPSNASPPPTPGLSVPSDGFRQTHRTSRSGPSVLEQVISKTRPSYLPPKAKQEDLKHLADWEAMMKQSRVIGKYLF